MIRAFPKGFKYPIPRGWPEGCYVGEGLLARPWEDPDVRKEYRGFGVITCTLAQCAEHHISELLTDVKSLETGLNCHVFKGPSAYYYDFATILQHLGFRRLVLTLCVRGQERTGWRCYRSGLLSRALANAHRLEYISLYTNFGQDAAHDSVTNSDGGLRAGLVPLRTIFPVESWHSLRHFRLSGFIVDKDDLIEFLKALPALRSLFLGHLSFVNNGGCLRDLLQDMRDTLDWQKRDPQERPAISVSVPTEYMQIGHAIFIGKEVSEFLYGGRPESDLWDRAK